MNKAFARILIFGIGAFTGFFSPDASLFASDEPELSLSDLLDLKVTVATKKVTSLRETPGIVTVITREQILDMGARDIVDVLMRAVPGYSVVTEIEGGQLLSMRGLNAIDGKFLVMLDGLDINEEKFGVTQFARHFPVATIDRIEIIRGPGSSIYGGYASLGVINILTRSFNQPGSYVSTEVEQGSRAFLSRTIAAGVARDLGDLKYRLNTVMSKSLLSDQKATSFYGDPIDLKDASIDLANLSFLVQYKGSYAKGLVDIYRAPELYFDEPDSAPWQHLRERWDTYQVELGHELQVNSQLQLTPFANYKLQYPYWVDQGPYWFRNRVERKTGGVNLRYELSDKTTIIGGFQSFVHTLYRAPHLNEAINEEVLKGNKDIDHISYRNDSVYAQYMNDNSLVNITLGLRYDKTDIHGEFAAPRVGFTKVWNDLHAKYMAARSFRVPGGIIPNRVEDNSTYTIKPETTLNNEVEVGYRFTETFWAALNVFDHLMHKPIIYSTGENGVGSYANGGELGSRGFETELRYQSMSASATLVYSYYRLTKTEVDSARIPDHPYAGYGQAQNKASLVMGYKVNRELSVNPSVSLIGDRFTYAEEGAVIGVDGNGDELREPNPLKKLPLTTLVNVNLRKASVLGVRGLEGSLAIQNITDARLDIAQPYQAEYPVAPIPFASRSYMLRLEYEM